MSDIWADWAEHYRRIGIDPSRICRDGIVDENAYRAVKQKILFIARETNDHPGGDMREFLRDGPRLTFGHAVARWAAGLLQGFPPYESLTSSDLTIALRSIALINLKKKTAGARANPWEIHVHAKRDRELLRRQIREIAPDLIIACGTIEPLLWLLDLHVDGEYAHVGPFLSFDPDYTVTPFRHPS